MAERRYKAEVCEPKVCPFRSCLSPNEDKGTYVQGRGYTSYHKNPKLVCWNRHLRGCYGNGDSIPEPNPENARCCHRPNYRRKGDAPTNWQQCETCGDVAPKWAAKVLNELPTLPGVSCKHDKASSTLLTGHYECKRYDGGCGGVWDHRPQPLEVPQHDTEWMLQELKKIMDRIKT